MKMDDIWQKMYMYVYKKYITIINIYKYDLTFTKQCN